MKSIVPILVIGSGILILFSNKSSGQVVEKSVPNSLKGVALITCNSIKIINKSEFNSSLKDLATQVIKSSPSEKNHEVRILDIFELAVPKCYEKFNSEESKSTNQQMLSAILISEIIRVYRSTLFPEITEESQVWEGVKIESLKSIFLKQLNIPQSEFDKINNKFQKVLQFPIPISKT